MAEPSNNPKEDSPPPVFLILLTYIFLGSVVSFLTGREPGTLPDNILLEVAPALIVVCGFLASYSVFDVMAVGVAKTRAKYMEKKYTDLPPREPEEVYLAIRVQTNQVEQMPIFIVGSLSCAIFVNGTVAGVMALIWAILRRCYASVYRSGVGVPMADIGLSRFTIPAYFVCHTMLMAAAVHAMRSLL